MAVNPIDYFTAVYGVPPWTTISLSWDGTAATYTLFEGGTDISLVTGTEKSYEYPGQPDTRYEFRLETETVLGTRALSLVAYTAPLPAPSGRSVSAVTATNVSLDWQPVLGATTYEVANVSTDYSIVATTTGTSTTISGLSPATRYSYAIRTVLGSVRSPWSPPLTITTSPASTVTPGIYTFAPTSVAVWRAGRAGSSTPSWRPTADDHFHGDGWVWGDTAGVQTTYFFYGSPNPFVSIAGASITRVEIYTRRSSIKGAPGAVLSHWCLHPYASKPSGEPTPSESEYDAGILARGAAEWVELPLPWGAALVTNGAHKGVAWGAITDRYQVADNPVSPEPPVLGTLRFTVA